MNQPIIRWTIGPTTKDGFEVLEKSVNRFGKIYPEFRRIVCYNQIKKNNLPYFENKVELYEQKENDIDIMLHSYQFEPNKSGSIGSGWKLCPPRFDKNAHELWIDNDIIIRNKISSINAWLNSENVFLCLEGKYRIYGFYDSQIPKSIKICAGFFGIPPKFDFNEKIIKKYHELKEPLGGYNEQGLVASILSEQENCIYIPQSQFKNLEQNETLTEDFLAIHFVGVNRSKHKAWEEYKIKNILI